MRLLSSQDWKSPLLFAAAGKSDDGERAAKISSGLQALALLPLQVWQSVNGATGTLCSAGVKH